MALVSALLAGWLVSLTGCDKPETPAASDAGSSVVGQRIQFGKDGGSEQYRITGWSHTEQEFTWTEGTSAQLELPIAPDPAGLKLKVTASGLTHPPELPTQLVELFVNGQKITEWQAGSKEEFVATIPGKLTNADKLTVKFQTPKAASPKSLGVNEDPRVLGICVHSVELTKL